MTRFALERKPLPALALLAAVAGAAFGLAPAPDAAQEPSSWAPGGLVRIPAGNVVVGLDEKRGKELVEKARTPVDRWVLAGEIGRHQAYLQEYWISPTHVTNEMYLEYVQATGARPPATWAALSKEQIQQIIEAGKTLNPGYSWSEENQGLWWEKHWQDEGVAWKMPPDRALEPVVFVNWDEAMAYCTWAGLRLPSEAELVRAGRGDGDQDYPFGSGFDREAVAHIGTQPSAIAFKRTPVAMLKKNVSPFGVRDLVGNVWSWTTSTYLPFEGFPSGGLKLPGEKRGETVTVIPNWDGSRKVLKGGTFQMAPEFCRLDVRVGCDTSARVSIIGFRVASSGKPATDATLQRARAARSSVLGFSPERDLDGARVLGAERRSWPDMAAIAARREKPSQAGFTLPELPADYRVFGACEVLGFAPLANPFEREDYPEVRTLAKNAYKDLVFPTLGVFATSVELAEPALPPGSYVVAWMPAFKDQELLELGATLPADQMPKTPAALDEVKAKRAAVQGRLLLPGKEHLLFLDQDGAAVGAVPLLGNGFDLLPEKPMRHDLVLNRIKHQWEFHVKIAGKGAKAYGAQFAVRAADPAQNEKDYWEGDFGVVDPPPGARSVEAEIGPRRLPPE